MSTASQIFANRANATHSTGPTTDAGKATSSQNGLKHGLASGQLIIPGESVDAFNAVLANLLKDHQPVGTTETMLIQDMAKHHWLADRALRMQNEAIAQSNGELPANFGLLIRYQTANERAYHKALTALNASRKTRLAELGFASKQAAKAAPKQDPTPKPTPPTDEEFMAMFRKGLVYNPETGIYERH